MKQHASGAARSTLAPMGAIAPLGAIILCFLLASCGVQAKDVSRGDIVRIIDEAFALILPVTTSAIAGLKNGMGTQDEGKVGGAEARDSSFLPVASIDESTGKLVGRWARNDAVIPGAVIASPLAAGKIAGHMASLDPSAQSKMPALIVPFGKNPGDENPEIHVAEYDFSQAYTDMGKEAARLTREASGRNGYEAVCGILFQGNFMRDKSALDVFVAAFSEAFGEAMKEHLLVVDILENEALKLDPVGATKAAVAALTEKNGMSVVVLAIDDAAAAEAAAATAAGEATAATSADVPESMVFMADLSAWGDREPAPGVFRYGIRGDEKGLARAAIGMAKDIADGGKADMIRKVPLRFGRIFKRIF